MRTFLGKIALLFLVSLAASACTVVDLRNPPPVGVPASAVASLDQTVSGVGSSAIVSQTKKVLVDQQEKAYPLMVNAYKLRASGTNYSEDMRSWLTQLADIYRRMGEDAAALYLSCKTSPDATVRDKGMAFAASAFKLAETENEFSQLGLGYTYAGLEKNFGFITKAKEKYANALSLKADSQTAEFNKAAEEFSATLAQAAPNRTLDPSTPAILDPSGNSEVVVTASAEAKNREPLLHSKIEQALAGTLLERSANAKLMVNLGKLEGAGGVWGFKTILLGPLNPEVWGGGASSFQAALAVNGGTPKALPVNTYEIVARNESVLASLIATRVVDAANFALLRQEAGIPE